MNKTYFRYDAGSYDKALVKAERALEIEEKELGARDEQMAELYRLLADIWTQVYRDKCIMFIVIENIIVGKIVLNQ